MTPLPEGLWILMGWARPITAMELRGSSGTTACECACVQLSRRPRASPKSVPVGPQPVPLLTGSTLDESNSYQPWKEVTSSPTTYSHLWLLRMPQTEDLVFKGHLYQLPQVLKKFQAPKEKPQWEHTAAVRIDNANAVTVNELGEGWRQGVSRGRHSPSHPARSAGGRARRG